MDGRRVMIATFIGLLTGCYCAASLFIPALKPPGLTSGPEVWWLAMLVIGRTSQGFVVGLADRINIHPALRGAVIGAAMTLQLAVMPLFGPFKVGAVLLMATGIVYGIIEDVVATWVTKRYFSNRQDAV
jgi:MFS family permease